MLQLRQPANKVMTQAKQPPVLIVGSGPTGLILALTLIKNNVSVRIVEKNSEFHHGIRGTSIQPRTLEIFKFLGIVDDVLAVSTPPLLMAIHGPADQIVKTVEWAQSADQCPQVPFPEPASASQAELERIIRTHLAKLGVTVELGVELVDIQQDDDSVTAQLVREDVHEIFGCQYIVGADGAKSNVRKLLGLPFIGQSILSDRMLTANVKANFNREYWHMWGSFSALAIGLKPVEPSPLYQIQALGPNLPEILPLNIDGVQELFNSISGGTDVKIENVECATEWRANIRMTKSFNVGRVFLAGDSAHCHSPTGGQGANTAIQDALNLGWKLGLVLKNLAPQSLLDSYGIERIPVVAEMLNLSTELHSLAFPRIEGSSLGIQNSEKPEDIMFRPNWFLQLGINYRWSPIVIDENRDGGTGLDHELMEANPYGKDIKKIQAGDRAPDATELINGNKETTLFDLFSVCKHTVLVFPGNNYEGLESDIRALNERGRTGAVEFFLVVSDVDAQNNISPTHIDRVLIDGRGHVYGGYGVGSQEKVFVVIRPDGVVGAYTLGTKGLEQYFSTIFL